MKPIKGQYRQGDVLLTPAKEIPAGDGCGDDGDPVAKPGRSEFWRTGQPQ